MNTVLNLLLILLMSLSSFGVQKSREFSSAKHESSDDISILDIDNSKDKAPDFKLKDTNDKNIRLSDYKGKIVIIDFWATWCAPCRKGIPDLIDLQNEYKDMVIVIGISLDADTKPDVIPFIKKYGINYPIAYGNSEVVRAYGNIQAIPTSFIVDQSGKIVDKHVGLVDKATYVNKIKELLKK